MLKYEDKQREIFVSFAIFTIFFRELINIRLTGCEQTMFG